MPTDLLDAISHARVVMSWHEGLPEEDLPPVWMWPLDEEIKDHFDRLKVKRKSGHADWDDDDRNSGPMLQNEYAKGRGRRT